MLGIGVIFTHDQISRWAFHRPQLYTPCLVSLKFCIYSHHPLWRKCWQNNLVKGQRRLRCQIWISPVNIMEVFMVSRSSLEWKRRLLWSFRPPSRFHLKHLATITRFHQHYLCLVPLYTSLYQPGLISLNMEKRSVTQMSLKLTAKAFRINLQWPFPARFTIPIMLM